MNITTERLTQSLLLVLAMVGVARAQAPVMYEPAARIATFDEPELPKLQLVAVQAANDRNAYAGAGSLKLTPAADAKGPLRAAYLSLGSKIDPAKTAALSMAMKAAGPAGGVRVRLGWFDDKGRLVRQRTVGVDAEGKWKTYQIPLHTFRWGELAAGWEAPAALRIGIETEFEAVWVDEIQLVAAGKDEPTADQRLTKLAFGDRDSRVVASERLFVGTDATDALAEADLLRLRGNMVKSRKMVARLFGEAVKPMSDPSPAALLIFKDAAGYADFWKRRGAQWAVTIGMPRAGGYTVQDTATSTYDAKLGTDRPVWLHESVHAVAARDLRLQPGNATHGWLQEGLANYVQLCVYPKSLPPEVYPREFAAGVRDEENALFRPLKKLLNEPATTQRYAQLASLIAYLVEAKPQWLPAIAAGVAENRPMDDILKQLGTDYDQLQADWLAWGRKRFAEPRKDGAFEVPLEFK